MTTFSKRAKSPADHKSIGEQAAGLIDGAIAHDNIDLAVKLCELALPEARASRDAGFGPRSQGAKRAMQGPWQGLP